MEELMEKPRNKSREKEKKKKTKGATTSRAPLETESVENLLKNAAEGEFKDAAGEENMDKIDDENLLKNAAEAEFKNAPEGEICDDICDTESEIKKEEGYKSVVQDADLLTKNVAENVGQIEKKVETVKPSEQVLATAPISTEKQMVYADLNRRLKSITLSETKLSTIEPLLSETPEQEKFKIAAYTESQLSALYMNSELESIDQFTSDFVEAELKGLNIQQHPLFELLSNYLQVKTKMHANSLEMNQVKKDYEMAKENLWSISSSVVSKQGKCLDGNVVVGTHTSTKATFHRSTYQGVVRLLSQLRELSTENQVLFGYSAAVLKIQIEHYVDNIVTPILSITGINSYSTVQMGVQAPSPHLHPYICDLRLCISIIFHFQRRLIRDTDFIKETRRWLSQLICLLLRLATWQDHLFIINHILRCPAGVSTWASTFVQIPVGMSVDSPFSNYEINHLVSILALILMPVQRRDKFLEELAQQKDEPTEALWVIVDSDGEEDEESGGMALRENDLVALLNQVPLENLFRNILLIRKRDQKDVYDSDGIDEGHILRFFSFSTSLLRILHRGLRTYDQHRYIQFCKRLSRLIRHVVQYATDQWEWFMASRKCSDLAMMERLQVEYDAFFLRAIYYLYTSEKLGAWQFLAVVPFGTITERTLWKIFFFLHDTDCKPESILDPVDKKVYTQEKWESLSQEQFEDKLIMLPEDECYYLLNTFANMALCRKEEDMAFIRTATMDLLQVGFFIESTQESCSKNARILLTHITSKHPHLLTDILKSIRENSSRIGSLALYLYEDLPISVWQLTDADIETLSTLILQNALQTDESRLARMILSRLNWGSDDEGNLFLPYSMHCKIALLIAKAVELDPGYLQWAWQTAFRLRLHISDKGFTSFQDVKDIENFPVIYKGVKSHQPFACFLSVLISSYGHHVPLICSKGMDQLLLLQANQKHEAVLFALNLIIPLFINCQESLINLEKFQNVLQALLAADKTYINYAKSFVSSQNTILEQFGNMIESQIANHELYGLDSPRYIARLWVNSLVSVPNWSRDYGAIYLLDVIIKASFFHKDTLEVISGILKDLLQCCTPDQTSTIGALFKWAGQGSSTLLINTSLATCPYLAYVMIEVEFEERERSTGLWHEILIQLKGQKRKVNVDLAIKTAASKLKVASFSSGSLSFFRWAQQALDTPIDHPILVLLWQKFFCLYLCRILPSGGVERGCVGDKFFEGVINFGFLKRCKRRLSQTVEFYKGKTMGEEFAELSPARQLFYMGSLRVFTAYTLWLEEPRLQDSSLYLPSLPMQYEPALLNLVMQFSDAPWVEYVDYETVKEQQVISIKTWRSANYREKKNINLPLRNAGSSGESDDPVERMFRRLQSYDVPKQAPTVQIPKPLISQMVFTDQKGMMGFLQPFINTLKDCAHCHAHNVSEQKALDCGYQELLPQLYRSTLKTIKQSLPCSGTNKTFHCAGPALIFLQAQETKIVENVEALIQSNRRKYETLMLKFQGPVSKLCMASVTLQHAIKVLQEMKANGDNRDLGVSLFYYILSLLNEETANFLPTKHLFTECLERLGQSHIHGDEIETPKLLKRILEEASPLIGMYLAPHFSPVNAATGNFLLMYQTISDGIGQRFDLQYSLLSKFDVQNWLYTKRPKLVQRSQFIQLVLNALLRLGQEPPGEALCLQEAYRLHLVHIFEYQFPEHYGEILMHILKASNGGDSDCIAISAWMDILNSLARPIVWDLGGKKRELLRQYAQNQQILHYQELLDTATLLYRHFTNDRFQYGLYGLYPKTRNYIDVIVLFLGICGHALIISALNTHQGALGDKIGEIVFPLLRDMFMPWLVPYWTTNMKDNMASWIKQLTDDRQVLLPWIPANTPFAQKAVDMFFECVLFLVQTLPGSNNILSSVWVWYVSHYAHESVKDHILNVIHRAFVSLPWQKFWPSVSDIELMLKVVDQYLPECHVFLGHVFMEVPWKRWSANLSGQRIAAPVRVRVHHCLLNLLVKLSNEPNVRANHGDRLRALLVQAESGECFDWPIVEPASVKQIFDWYVMSCDTMVLFKNDPLNLDFRVLQFLKMVSCYLPVEQPSIAVREKREIYIKSYMMLISVFTCRHKAVVPSKEVELVNLIKVQLNEMESLLQDQQEVESVLSAILTALNLASMRDPMIKCFEQWLASREGDGVAVKAFLRIAGKSVFESQAVATIYETAIETYFYNNVANIETTSWDEVAGYLQPNYAKFSVLIDVLLSKGCILTLHVLLLQKKMSSQDYQPLLNMSLHWLQSIKTTETIESKVPLLWADILDICLTYCQSNETSAAAILYKFSKHLLQISEQKDTIKWGSLWNAIGIGKQSEVTLNFKFLCRAVAGYVLAQLPDSKGNPQTVRRVANAPCTVGQTGGNTEVAKVLLKLDFGQPQGKIKDCAEQALKSIQDPKNSLQNVNEFLSDLLLQLYTKPYLKGIVKS